MIDNRNCGKTLKRLLNISHFPSANLIDNFAALKAQQFIKNSIIVFAQVRPENFHYLTRIHYIDRGDGVWGEHEIDYILFLQKEVDVKPNPGEVSEVRWIKRSNLDKEIASLDAPLTPWFELILKSGRLGLWWDNLHRLKNFEDYDTIHKLN